MQPPERGGARCDVQSLDDALADTAGAATNIYGYDPRDDALNTRGFDVTYDGVDRGAVRRTRRLTTSSGSIRG